MSVERPSTARLFPLILPKKHSLITQKRFWPFFGVFSGFLGVPQHYIFWSFKSVFWQFLREKNGWKARDPAGGLVELIVNLLLVRAYHVRAVQQCEDKTGLVWCWYETIKVGIYAAECRFTVNGFNKTAIASRHINVKESECVIGFDLQREVHVGVLNVHVLLKFL